MSEPLTITIPGTPSKLLAPNKARRTHYLAKAAASRIMRADAYLAAFRVVGARRDPVFAGPVQLTETIRWGKGERRVDLSAVPSLCKPLEDGLVDAGVMGDDSQVVRLIVQQERAPDGIGSVVFVIERAAVTPRDEEEE